MRKPLLFIALIVCAAIGCKLDDPGFPKGSVVTPSLLESKWYLKKLSVYNDPYFGSYDTVGFTTKDYYIFKSDKTFEYSSSDPDTLISGKYAYDAAIKRVILTTQELDTLKIIKLTTDSLLLQTEIYGSAGAAPTIDTTIYRYAHN